MTTYRALAARIDAHLQRFESDPDINVDLNPPHGRTDAGTPVTFVARGLHGETELALPLAD